MRVWHSKEKLGCGFQGEHKVRLEATKARDQERNRERKSSRKRTAETQ